MNDAQDGTLERLAGGYVIRFERRYDTPVDAVWAALTEPDQLRQWIGATEVELELVAGGRMITRTSGPPEVVEVLQAEGAPLESRDTVLRVEPRKLFEHTFGGSPSSVVRWELAPDGDGCVLRLTHEERTDTTGEQSVSYLAGWHDLLDSLEELLAGTEPASTGTMQRWEAYREHYDGLARE